jgi:hypothetical protein
MTAPLLFRRRATAPRRRIVSVTNHWRLTGENAGREVLVRLPDGQVVVDYLPDTHPALVAFLQRAAVAA